MLQPLSGFTGYTIHATDGILGKVEEFYFDDVSWAIRYMIVKTGGWLNHRSVLISVVALGKPDWMTQTFPVNLSCEQVRNSPDIDTESPVRRHHEIALHNHYQWPFYWDSTFPDTYGLPTIHRDEEFTGNMAMNGESTGDPHLQSTRFMLGNHIRTTDGDIGHVDDFIVDTESWTLDDLIVATGVWHFGKKVLIPMNLIRSINDVDQLVYLDCSREDIRNHHEFDPLLDVMVQEEPWIHA